MTEWCPDGTCSGVPVVVLVLRGVLRVVLLRVVLLLLLLLLVVLLLLLLVVRQLLRGRLLVHLAGPENTNFYTYVSLSLAANVNQNIN